MTKERIEKDLAKVRRQLTELQKREKDLAEQWQMAEDAEAMKWIKKYKISSGKLQLLNKVSEGEILQLLAQKEREEAQDAEQKEAAEVLEPNNSVEVGQGIGSGMVSDWDNR